jgi:NAD(P)-dependent dehydrogenase (short-subunit alcohol dehydrogenase family)
MNRTGDKTHLSLAEKRVVVIGGTSGIGFAVALLAHELGAALVLASSTSEKVKA